MKKNTPLFYRAYLLSFKLDQKVKNERGAGMSQQEFNNTALVLTYPQTKNGQEKFFNVLNNLSIENMLDRVQKVSKLVSILNKIQNKK